MEQIINKIRLVLFKHLEVQKLVEVMNEIRDELRETENTSNPVEAEVMPLQLKEQIRKKMVERLNLFDRQLSSDYGFANKQKIRHKIAELKKCIQIVQSA